MSILENDPWNSLAKTSPKTPRETKNHPSCPAARLGAETQGVGPRRIAEVWFGEECFFCPNRTVAPKNLMGVITCKPTGMSCWYFIMDYFTPMQGCLRRVNRLQINQPTWTSYNQFQRDTQETQYLLGCLFVGVFASSFFQIEWTTYEQHMTTNQLVEGIYVTDRFFQPWLTNKISSF